MEYQIPTDTKEMTEKFRIEKGGICGQACLAVIEQLTIAEVMNNWESLGLVFRGWSGWKQLKQYLEARGFQVTQRNRLKEYNASSCYIARVQWLGEGENKEKPFFGWGHWSKASAHTHFIVIIKNNWFFCNEEGLFEIDCLSNYLKENDGLITSHMEIK